MTRGVQVSAGDVDNPGYHVVRCAKFRRPVCTGWSAARCKELIRARVGEHGWWIVALEVTLDQVNLFVKAHRSECPPQIAHGLTGCTSRQLWADFRICGPAYRPGGPGLHFAATAGALSAETVRRDIGAQDEWPGLKGQAR